MRVAVFTNARTARQAERGLREGQSQFPGDSAAIKSQQAELGFELAFDTAFRGGAVIRDRLRLNLRPSTEAANGAKQQGRRRLWHL